MPSDDRFTNFTLNNTAGGDVIQQHGAGSVGKQVFVGPQDDAASRPPQTVNVQGDYIAADKTSSHFGDVTHDFRRPSDGPPDIGPEDRR